MYAHRTPWPYIYIYVYNTNKDGKKKHGLWRFLFQTPKKKGRLPWDSRNYILWQRGGTQKSIKTHMNDHECAMFQTWECWKWQKNFKGKDRRKKKKKGCFELFARFWLPQNSQISPPVDLDSCQDAIFAATPWTPLAAQCEHVIFMKGAILPTKFLECGVVIWFSEGFVRYGHSQMTIPDLKLPLASQKPAFYHSFYHASLIFVCVFSSIIPSCLKWHEFIYFLKKMPGWCLSF